MKNYFFVCSGSGCDFSKKAPLEDGLEKFCPLCASELLWECPACGRPIRNEAAKYCSLCKAEIKPQQDAKSRAAA